MVEVVSPVVPLTTARAIPVASIAANVEPVTVDVSDTSVVIPVDASNASEAFEEVAGAEVICAVTS